MISQSNPDKKTVESIRFPGFKFFKAVAIKTEPHGCKIDRHSRIESSEKKKTRAYVII